MLYSHPENNQPFCRPSSINDHKSRVANNILPGQPYHERIGLIKTKEEKPIAFFPTFISGPKQTNETKGRRLQL